LFKYFDFDTASFFIIFIIELGLEIRGFREIEGLFKERLFNLFFDVAD
jgi:hypothetical protein